MRKSSPFYLGKLPNDWDLKKVQDVTLDHKQGYYTKDSYTDTGTYIIRVTDLKNTKIEYKYMPRIDVSKKNYEDYKVEEGDFLFARSGGIGRYGIVRDEYPASIFASYLIRFKFIREIIDNYFFGYFFESYFAKKQLKAITQGSSNININAENIKSLSIPLPILKEQQKIAAILSSVDEAIEKAEQIIEQTTKVKKGLMQQLFTNGIDHNTFKSSLIGKIPEQWEVLPLQDVLKQMTDYVANGSFQSLRENVEVYDEEHYAYYVRLFDLRLGLGHDSQKYVDKKSYDYLKKSYLEGNEILIANIGANVGEVFLMPEVSKPATIAPNMIVMRSNGNNNSKFIGYYLQSEVGKKNVNKAISGSGQPKLNKTDLKKIPIAVPPKMEQEQIVNTLLSVDSKIQLEHEKLNYLKGLKKALMQQLLTGKVRVPIDEENEEEVTAT